MKRTTASLLTGALAAGTFAVLATAAPSIASASGCGTTVITEADYGSGKTFNTTSSRGATGATGTNVIDSRAGVHAVAPEASKPKVATYREVGSIPLAGQTAQSNYLLTESGTGTAPGYQLVTDLNGAAPSGFAVLVYEPGYGEGVWHTSKLANGGSPEFGVPEGLGYEGLGTIQQFSDANPDAVINAFGFSLGSGVTGDRVIDSIRFGCNVFDFQLANRAPVAAITSDENSDDDYRTFLLSGATSSDPDGDPLTYAWAIASPLGRGPASPATSTSAEFTTTFPKGPGTYTVNLTVSDGEKTSTTSKQITVTPPQNTVGGPLAGTGADVKGLAAVGGLVAVGSAAGLIANKRRKSTTAA
jgi:hypothetical protein